MEPYFSRLERCAFLSETLSDSADYVKADSLPRILIFSDRISPFILLL